MWIYHLLTILHFCGWLILDNSLKFRSNIISQRSSPLNHKSKFGDLCYFLSWHIALSFTVLLFLEFCFIIGFSAAVSLLAHKISLTNILVNRWIYEWWVIYFSYSWDELIGGSKDQLQFIYLKHWSSFFSIRFLL